jgi:small subunit ribosomal protein S16
LLKIRLRRTGAKKQPSYRVVVTEARSPRDGTFLEILGHYNPLTVPTTFEIKEERVREWLGRGAQPTDRVQRLLSTRGIMPAPPHTGLTKPGASAPATSAPAASAPAASAPAASAPAASAPAEPAPAASSAA